MAMASTSLHETFSQSRKNLHNRLPLELPLAACFFSAALARLSSLRWKGNIVAAVEYAASS